MPDSFDDSFRIYVDAQEAHQATVDSANQPGQGDATAILSELVNNVLEDMKKMGQLHARLHDTNEQIKAAQGARRMEDLRGRLNVDLDYLLTQAKQINKKFDGLVAANAAQRRRAGSSDDHTRASIIAELAENLRHMMRDFQGLRVQMETDHRHLIESRYFGITREKATAETIDNLIASEELGHPLHHAIQAHGRAAVAEAVAEIQVRRDTMREVRRSLLCLHQIFLGIATPVEGRQAAASGGDFTKGSAAPVSPVAVNTPGAGLGKLTGIRGLNDYEKEIRKQAYIAIAIALVVILIVIIASLKIEYKLEHEN